MDGGPWWAAVQGVAKSQTRLSNFTFTFHFHALEKEMATHSSVLAWRIPETGEPGGLPSMGSHRVGHDWSDLAAAAASFINSLLINQQCKINHVLYLKNTRQQQRTDFFFQGASVEIAKTSFPKTSGNVLSSVVYMHWPSGQCLSPMSHWPCQHEGKGSGHWKKTEMKLFFGAVQISMNNFRSSASYFLQQNLREPVDMCLRSSVPRTLNSIFKSSMKRVFI